MQRRGLDGLIGVVRQAPVSILLRLVEFLRRLLCRLDPRLYFECLRIRNIEMGRLRTTSNKYVIVVTYASPELPNFTMSLIDAYNRANYNVIVVANGNFDLRTKEIILDKSSLFIERANIGRDFGGYKDAISVILGRFELIEQLVIANDSVYYFESGLDALVHRIKRLDGFGGISEVFEHAYHVSSYLLSFSKRIVESREFRKFWVRYRPISTRMWTIMSGEVMLTKCLLAAGYRPQVLFRADDLYAKLRALDHDGFNKTLALFPIKIRERLIKIGGSSSLSEKMTSGELAKAAIEAIKELNQVHAAGFFFLKYFSLPIIKRDIAYRGLFSAQEATRNVISIYGSVSAEIANDLARRAPPTRTSFLCRMLYSHGYI